MNLAPAAALLFFVFLPGLIFRRSYLSGAFSRKYSSSSITDEILASVIPAVLFQAGAVIIVDRYSGYRVNFATLGVLLNGSHSDAEIEDAFRSIGGHLPEITAYNVILWLAAWLLGLVARIAVLKGKLDLRFNWLRFSNEWYYFLSGRQWYLAPGHDYDLVVVEILDSTSNWIYQGILEEFPGFRDGSLDSICLTQVRKRKPVGGGLPNRFRGEGS